MADLVRWEPSNINTLRSTFDSLFDDLFAFPTLAPVLRFGNPVRGLNQNHPANVPIDIIENADDYVIKANVPGIKKEDLEVQVNDESISITGKYSEETETNNQGYMVRERHSGSFSRTIPVGKNVQLDKVEAQYQNGVLELRLPKSQPDQPKTRKIDIQ